MAASIDVYWHFCVTPCSLSMLLGIVWFLNADVMEHPERISSNVLFLILIDVFECIWGPSTLKESLNKAMLAETNIAPDDFIKHLIRCKSYLAGSTSLREHLHGLRWSHAMQPSVHVRRQCNGKGLWYPGCPWQCPVLAVVAKVAVC